MVRRNGLRWALLLIGLSTAASGAWAVALHAHRGQAVTAVHLDTDHVYSDHRIALEAALITWLQSLPQ